jgi:protein-S-isoprenylcysteine O-methyltransferase Ste14
MAREPAPLRYDFPLWAPLLQTVGLLLFHALLPFELSRLASRHGWSGGHPAAWNLLGLLPVAAGATLITWVVVLHDREAPKHGWRIEPTPFEPAQYLIVRGPYAYTRNPIYVSHLTIWSGWAAFYGSMAVALGVVVLWLSLVFVVLPYEERGLIRQLGEPYLRYQRQVHRWFGRHSAEPASPPPSRQ